jgi:hypothetical protein
VRLEDGVTPGDSEPFSANGATSSSTGATLDGMHRPKRPIAAAAAADKFRCLNCAWPVVDHPLHSHALGTWTLIDDTFHTTTPNTHQPHQHLPYPHRSHASDASHTSHTLHASHALHVALIYLENGTRLWPCLASSHSPRGAGGAADTFPGPVAPTTIHAPTFGGGPVEHTTHADPHLEAMQGSQYILGPQRLCRQPRRRGPAPSAHLSRGRRKLV